MKKLLKWSLCACLLAGSGLWALASVPPKQEVYRVKNVNEFLMALGSNRTIILEPGPAYNISEGLRDDDIYAFLSGLEGIYLGSDFYDACLTFNGIENLTLRGEGQRPLRLLSEVSYYFVLSFEKCKNINIINLEIGHAPELGTCDGGVLEFTACENILVQQCQMFGCGTQGIRSIECRNLRCEGSDIYGCNDGIFSVYKSSKIVFSNCHFYDNTCSYGAMIIVDAPSREVSMENCVLYSNGGTLFDIRASLALKDCYIRHWGEALGTMYAVKQENSTLLEPKQYKHEN
jgi:Endopolygalacturonase